MSPQLLALDWGTSSLRAFLMGDGQVLETRQSPQGIQHLPQAGIPGYQQALAQIAADWLHAWPALPIVACGMVGSAQGWKEAPYVPCPADIHTLVARGVTVASGLGPAILIAPGVLFDVPEALPEVMRGEEIQIAGALQLNPAWAKRAWMLLPGTHSKWALIEDGLIVRSTTYLTGELFAILKAHSILGRLMPADAPQAVDTQAFVLGVNTARHSAPGDLSHQMFATRTLGLTGRLPPAALSDYLSGLLIGHELLSGLASVSGTATAPLIMIGAPPLCARYAHALSLMGYHAEALLDNTAPAGLWHFALAAGLISSGKE